MSIKDDFLALLGRKGITRVEACNRMGISATTLSQYLSGKYGASEANIDKAVSDFIATEEEKDQLQKVSKTFVSIFRAQEAIDTIRKVHIDPDILMLTAEPGYGKTTVLEEYAARNSKAIKIDAVSSSPYALLRDLCESLNLAKSGSVHDMVGRCIKGLRDKEMLIMVDECEFLSSDALNALRRIHDLADVGLVLAGTKHLVTTVANEPQLAGRVARRIQLDALTPEQQQESFEQVLASLLPVINDVNYMDNPRVVRAFWHYSGGDGYRYLFKLVKNVVSSMDLCEKGITPKLIKECAEDLVRKNGLTK